VRVKGSGRGNKKERHATVLDGKKKGREKEIG